ncbi:hypothetical protein Poli38472_003982 [Pythium oligandrum]|uniref:C3H1-type domain-containing protein n=1 Tax=Pythium oligandrum TaxID=41045 RepID=A0A8K1CMF0_PYTOL|nr:hypothetical protein Poli38472_003982 [Pythium oligandrum]|eukprot:TMW66217.1 hypothetical protein Poli38472_003982 [Pythium oligandrum]
MEETNDAVLTTLAALHKAYEGHTQRVNTETDASAVDAEPLHVRVRGHFVRKRKLSKGLIFGDVVLADGELLEVMIRARPGGLAIDQIKQINWDVHLGDIVVINGILSCKESTHLLLALMEVHVEEYWSEAHPGEFFDHTQFATMTAQELWSANHPGEFFGQKAFASVSISGGEDPQVTAAKAPSAAPRGSVALAPNSQANAPHKYTNIVQINGLNACKYYFSGAYGANCLRGEQCHFWHGKPEDYEQNRQIWLTKRQEQRRAVSHIEGDEHDPEEKWLKAQRARIFCDWLVEKLGEEQLGQGTGVIDVAGGKGEIPIQLWNIRGIRTTLIDPRPMKLNKKNRKIVASKDNGRGKCDQLLCYLTNETFQANLDLFANCSLLVGMHPDEATEIIVDIALKYKKPFAIVPCCVMSRLFPDRRCRDGTPVATYDTLVQYLREKDPRIQSGFLSFTGRNQVLYLFDFEQSTN